MNLRRICSTAQPFALACAVAWCCATPVIAGSTTTVTSGGAGASNRVVMRESRSPLVIRVDENGVLAKDAAERLIAAIKANPDRLVTLSVGSIDIDAGGDVAKQKAMAKQLLAIMKQVKKAQPGAAIALRGLPLETVGGSKQAARELNDRFANVVKAADALVLKGGIIGRGSNDAVALSKSFPEAMRLAGSKAVLFKAGEGWKSRIVNEGVASSSTGGAAAGAGTDGNGAAPQVAASSAGAAAGSGNGEAIGEVLGGWGGAGGAGDLNGDGNVDAIDLAIALSMGGGSGGGSGAGGAPSTPPVVISSNPAGESSTSGSLVDGEGGAQPGDENKEGEAGGGDGGGSASGGGDAGGGGEGGGDGGGGSAPPVDPPVTPPAGGGGSPLDQLFLANGSGFTGATAVPPNVGAPGEVGYEAVAIARWSTVPFQTFKENLRVGVVAFHRNGIDRVSFSANGGAWLDATAMTINPSTGVSEYWVTLKASDFPDGAVEIRAIAYPKLAGKPRVLGGIYQTGLGAAPPMNGEHSMFAWANFGGTLDREARYVSATGNDSSGNGTINNPYLTLSKAAEAIQTQYGTCDNGTIYCLPGEYDFEMKWGFTAAKANDRFITITPAPGVLRDQVVIEEARPKTGRIRLNNVTIKTNDAGNFYTGFNDLRTVLWIDNCYVSAKNGRYGSSQKVLSTCNPYITESVWNDAPDGPTDTIMVRNTTITKLCSDMVSGVQVVLNVNGGDIDPAETGAHPDIYQIYRPTGSLENHVVYGVRANNFLAQGIFIAALANGEKIRNCAFVNLVLDANQSNFTSQINRDSEHLLVVNCTIDQTFYIRTPGFDNVSFVGNIFKAVTLDLSKCTPVQVGVIDWRHNHFVDSTSYGTYVFGTDVTTGPAPVVNWALGNFQPLPSGCLANRLAPLYSNYDAVGSPREPMTAIGALEDE
jgi:hypothetical protein